MQLFPRTKSSVNQGVGVHATKFGMQPVFERYLQVYVDIPLVFATHSSISLKHKSNFGPKKIYMPLNARLIKRRQFAEFHSQSEKLPSHL